MTQTTQVRATAIASGAAATERFREKVRTGPVADKERVATLASEVLGAVHDVIRRHKVTYPEYDALKAWLIEVGNNGEWPLCLDAFVENVVEEVATENRKGSKGTIEGPFYVHGSPVFRSEATLPMRDGERGTPLLLEGQVRSVDGKPLHAAQLEIWHADADGLYSQFAPGIPEWNLRGTVITDAEGNFSIRTIQPAPYQIPHEGSVGRLIAAAGWHAWRPAHLHLKVSTEGHLPITSQLYFRGGEYLDSDIASAVKPELVIDPYPAADGEGKQVRYDLLLDPA
jgi:catechol 1,2-dioxygenase